jgi:hypothetical protein
MIKAYKYRLLQPANQKEMLLKQINNIQIIRPKVLERLLYQLILNIHPKNALILVI